MFKRWMDSDCYCPVGAEPWVVDLMVPLITPCDEVCSGQSPISSSPGATALVLCAAEVGETNSARLWSDQSHDPLLSASLVMSMDQTL